MTISTFSTLVSALDGTTSWTHRSDLTSRIPEFIALAEADMQIRCKLVEFEASGTISVTSGAGSLPADFVGMRSCYWDGASDTTLDFIPPDEMDRVRSTGTEDPGRYTITGSSLKVDTLASGSVVATYNARFTPITNSNQTNSLITNYPDVYLFGTLKQFALWSQDDTAAAKWSALMDQAVERVVVNNETRKYAGATLAVRAR